tara:strand:- start:9853 stop:10917 length:1065 start_codon:yes stop_codon:yes gene_type:complete
MIKSKINGWIRKEILNQSLYTVNNLNTPIKLNQNESPIDWPKDIKKQFLLYLHDRVWNRYPEINGENLRKKLAREFHLSKNQIIIGKGSNEVIQAITTATLSSGDIVCHLSPTFALYSLLSQHRGAKIIQSKLDYEFNVVLDDLINKSAMAKLTFIANPNSPTGKLLPIEIVKKVAEQTSGLVIVDEAYIDFSGGSAIPLIEQFENIIITRTFSKAWSLASFRLGYGIMHNSLALEIQKCMLPFNIDSPSALAGHFLLDHMDHIKKTISTIVDEREKLVIKLNALHGVKAWSSRTNFFMLETPLSPSVTFRKLAENGILVRDISSYPLCEKVIRVTVGTAKENKRLYKIITNLL